MTYQIIITEETANVAVTSDSYPIIIEYNATNLSANGAYGNSNVASYLASNVSIPILTTANVQASYFIGNGSQLTGLASSYGNANVAANLAAFGSNPISTTGNVTAGYVIGNGSLLTAITGGNVTGTVAQATVAATANTVAGANVTGTVANATFATSAATATTATTATSATTAGTVTTAAQANITSVGVLTSLSSTGNITGANINGNGSGLSSITGANITGTVANATYATTAGIATFATTANAVAGANVSGTVANATFATSAATATTAGTVTTNAQPNITSVGTLTNLDVSGNAVIGGNLTVNGDTVYTNVTSFAVEDPVIEMGRGANLSPLVSDDGKDRGERLWYYSGTEKSAFTGYDNSAGRLILATDVTIANEIVTVVDYGTTQVGNLQGTTVSVTGNITGANVNGNGSGLSSITGANVTGTVPLATAATTAGTVTDAAQGNITSVGTLSSLSVSGNITTSGNFVGNASALSNVPAGGANTQLQFNNGGVFAGNANVTFNASTGNLDIYNNRLTTANVTTTVQAFDDSVVNATTVNPGRIIFGTGVDGNLTAAMDATGWVRGSLFLVNQNVTKGDNGRRLAGASFDIPVTLTGNLANTSTRITATRQALTIGGANVYGMTSTNVNAWPSAVNGSVIAGTNGNIIVGNITLTGVQTASFGIQTNGTSTIATGVTVRNDFTGNIANCTGMLVTSALSAVGTTVSIVQNASTNHNTNFRSSTNYFFLNNTDDVAQNKLGSLRRYTEFNAVSGTTTGALTIDKDAGQVQQINLTGNISGITYSNFVSSASDGTNTDEQSDTVTLIFNQGATGNYGVTFPTGATYKYAGNVTALQSVVANSVSLVSVSAIRIGGTTTYLTTISPGFV